MDDQTLFNILTMLGLALAFPLMWAGFAASTRYYARRMPEAMPSHRSTVRTVLFLGTCSVTVLALSPVLTSWPLALIGAAILVPVMAASIVVMLRSSQRFHAAAVPAA